MEIYNTDFKNNTYQYGGAIYLSNERTNAATSVFKIIGNKFYFNQANQGGAIFAANNDIDIYENEFKNNSAGFI